jgi:ADP-ribosyl-[dinitrogen reductase] hydrolase
VPAPGVAAADHIEVRLFDRADPAENPNLEFTIDDAARAVATLRAEGRRVLLHCVHGQSRTPTVAARYAVLCGLPVAEALAAIAAAVPGARTNPTLRRALGRLGEPTRPSA